MAARSPRQINTQPPPYTTTHGGSGGGGPSAILRYLHNHFPNNTQLIGILTLVLTAGILLLLTGLGLTAAFLAFIFFSPIILLTSPVWFPIAAFLFVVLSFFGFGVTAAAALTWMYRYFRGMHPPGSDRVDYARSQLANTARGVNDYAREYGGYLHSKIKDAAPGA